MFRWFALLALVATVGVSGYHRRRAQLAGGAIPRRAESLLLIAGRILVAFPLFGGIVAYILHPPWMAWSSFAAPAWLRWLGAILGLLCVPAAHWTLTALGTNVSETVLVKTRHDLVTGGPYHWIRHPLYTTGITLFVSLGLMAANWFVLTFAVVALAAIRLLVVPVEERQLSGRFGEKFEDYRRRTGAMLPRLRSNR